MKFLRTVILLLICAVLPMSGLAASGLMGDCPMQHSMSTDGSMSAAMPGCDSMKSSSTDKAKGSFCKMTAQCQIGCQSLPVASLEVNRPAGVGSTIVFHYTEAFFVRDPGGLWRPPRAI